MLIIRNGKRIAKKLQDKKMETFYKYLSYSIIVIVIEIIISVITLIVFIFMIREMFYYPSTSLYGGFDNLLYLILLVVFLVFGMQFLIGLFQMRAFESLHDFFLEYQNSFPPHIRRDGIEGSSNLKTASILYMLGFLIITGVIAAIFQIIGFFKLANLKDLRYIRRGNLHQPQQTNMVDPRTEEGPTPSQRSNGVNYCPLCGYKVQVKDKFCGNCGNNLLDI
ncbi:MAG: zinc ribbon domain-containing protein [Promethearchaeia archaeon]